MTPDLAGYDDADHDDHCVARHEESHRYDGAPYPLHAGFDLSKHTLRTVGTSSENK
jgi:hypothetical protein